MPLPPVAGFRWSGVEAGIKKRGGLDLGLVVADSPASVAAIVTTNLVCAAPVVLAKRHAARGVAAAFLVNSGCANACTGDQGRETAWATTVACADALGVDPRRVLPASTGVIGAPLPADRLIAALPRAVEALRPDGAADFAHAIMTTDRGPKTAFAEVPLGRKRITIAGVAKGAGMIHPNMATTLAFVVTDARVGAPVLRRALRDAAADTFNAASVDGDTSTNDMIAIMASGAAGGPPVQSEKDAARFTSKLRDVLDHLARMIVADGEGSRHLVEIEVVDARSERDARLAARAIATSPLVKTAFHGQDPNWGRIVAAAGRSGARFDPERCTLWVGDVVLLRRGTPTGPEPEQRAHAIMTRPDYRVRLSLGAGTARARHLACDLGADYVRCNADYRS